MNRIVVAQRDTQGSEDISEDDGTNQKLEQGGGNSLSNQISA